MSKHRKRLAPRRLRKVFKMKKGGPKYFVTGGNAQRAKSLAAMKPTSTTAQSGMLANLLKKAGFTIRRGGDR